MTAPPSDRFPGLLLLAVAFIILMVGDIAAYVRLHRRVAAAEANAAATVAIARQARSDLEALQRAITAYHNATTNRAVARP